MSSTSSDTLTQSLQKGSGQAERVRALEAEHILQVYRRAPVVFTRGSGTTLFDIDDRPYLDFISGVGVTSLGHAHPGLTRAITQQAADLLHTSNLFFHPLQGEVAARLSRLSGLTRAFLCNSGTEAVEACLKFARRFWVTQGQRERTEYVALERAFAGRTFGSLSVTWDNHYRDPFQPLIPGVTFVAADDPAALTNAVTDRTAAIICEPIQGEGGVRPLTPALAQAIEQACARTGALLIADEVQTGMGRTGSAFYFTELGLTPDLVSVGKALGGGVPVGAALLAERIAAAVAPGDHGSTYGGNLLACRAALVVLDAIEGGLLRHVKTVGKHLEERLREVADRHAQVIEVRGRGLMWGLVVSGEAAPIVRAALERGLLVNATAQSVVRLLPPLIVTEQEIDRAAAMLDDSLRSVAEKASGA